MFIAKIQKSLTEPPTMLVYNESRSVQYEGPLTEQVDKWLGNHLKAFANCKITPDNKIEIINLVKARSW